MTTFMTRTGQEQEFEATVDTEELKSEKRQVEIFPIFSYSV